MEHEGSGDRDKKVVVIFEGIQESFRKEHQTREAIRNVVHDLEQTARELMTQILLIHQTPSTQIDDLCSSCQPFFDSAKVKIRHLQQVLPPNSYYRYHDHWKFVIQRLSFLCSFYVYIQTKKLATRYDVATMLGVHLEQVSGFHLDLDDYLLGVLTLANELSRLAVNCVILGDYQMPFQIASFVSELNAGFRLLNLKNDALRRKFDSLKYDVKKIEEVVYDITIRGLNTK